MTESNSAKAQYDREELIMQNSDPNSDYAKRAYARKFRRLVLSNTERDLKPYQEPDERNQRGELTAMLANAIFYMFHNGLSLGDIMLDATQVAASFTDDAKVNDFKNSK